MRAAFSIATTVLIAATLSSCASATSKGVPKETPPLMSQRMEQRWKRPDMSRRSIYDPGMKATFNKKADGGGWFGKKSYVSPQFAGASSFNPGRGNYVVPSFASGKSAEYLKSQSFVPAGKAVPMSMGDYVVPNNTFGEQKASSGSKMFSGGKDEYNTGSYYPAERSQYFNRKPVILKSEEDGKQKAPAYTEDQVRSLLGRP